MPRRAATSTLTIPFVLASLVGCGAGAPADALRPADPTFAAARGEDAPAVCHQVADEGTPLIVDWAPEAREDLEAALKQGVAVVHYDCTSIRVLPDCRADGTYAFIGTTRKEQLITLTNADEAQANLPLSGAKLGASIARGSTLDIGLILVGKKSTTPIEVAASALKGRCDGATHFVRSVTVGAFAMTTTTSGAVKVAADVFGFGAKGASDSARAATNLEGDVASCASSDPDAPKPPSQCGAPVRVQLLALSKATDKAKPVAPDTPAATSDKDVADVDKKDVACGKGLVESGGACVVAGTAKAAFDCEGKDLDTCAKQCAAGNAASCEAASDLADDADLDSEDMQASDESLKQQAAFDARACELGSSAGCAYTGMNYVMGSGVPMDRTKGVVVLQKACTAGSGYACGSLGAALAGTFNYPGAPDVPVDDAKAIAAYHRGCDAGYYIGCYALAQIHDKGTHGVAADHAQAVSFYKRACDASFAPACEAATK